MSENSNKKLLMVGMVLLTIIISLAILRDRFVNQNNFQISVNGEGRVSYEPDTAVVNLGVQVDKAPSAKNALDRMNTSIENITKALEGLGITKENIQTTNYSLYPSYDYLDGVTKQSGYNANQQLLVKIENLEKNSNLVSEVIQKASENGANQVNGVSFESSNLSELKNEAVMMAIADAKSKAETTANAAGVKLNKVIGWWENPIQVPGMPYYGAYGYGGEKGGGGVGPILPTGGREIIIQVSLNYSIK